MHWNLYVPFGTVNWLSDTVRLWPAGTKLAPKSSPVHTAVGGPDPRPDNRFRMSTTPRPNCLTQVNEWVSPPRLAAVTIWPGLTLSLSGSNAQSSTERSAVSSAMNSLNVVSPRPTHAF